MLISESLVSFMQNKTPECEGYGRLKALPTKKIFHWYEKQNNRPWLVTL